MYTTPEEVMDRTPYTDITMEQVRHAQLVIEAFTGRSESDIDDSRDLGILKRATIFQTVYMRETPDITFTQIKIGAGEGVSFRDEYSPFIAPLAAMATGSLSWLNTRSVRMGKTFQRGGGSYKDWWVRN